MRVLVLHSGGMDSTTCLFKAHAEGAEVFSLGVDYGQRLSVELIFAQRQCDEIGVRREVVSIRWQKPQREIPLDRDVDEMRKSVSTAFLPGRNALLLSIACAHGSGVGADEIHVGLNTMDYSGYPDCTPEFLASFQQMMRVANPSGPRIVAPLMSLTKREIAFQARSLGLGEHDTWSCYRPDIQDGAVVPCNRCDACVLHKHAWEQSE